MKYNRVAVLMGGTSGEREVSLSTGKAVQKSLVRSGIDAISIDATGDIIEKIKKSNADAVFIALHGPLGEDGKIQALLEIMGIPYTGSGVTACAVTMDKIISLKLFKADGLNVAPSYYLYSQKSDLFPPDSFFPAIIKPAREGSSLGISIAKDKARLKEKIEIAFQHSKSVLVEKFITGKEITVAVLNNTVMGSLEVELKDNFYNYSSKYDPKGAIHHVPPRIEKDRKKEVESLALRAYKLLGLKGAARIDFILPEDKAPVILEANTIPGMTETSLLPEICADKGISFDELVIQIMQNASLNQR